jgi:hypothetical protein
MEGDVWDSNMATHCKPLPTKIARDFHPMGCRAPLHDALGETQ